MITEITEAIVHFFTGSCNNGQCNTPAQTKESSAETKQPQKWTTTEVETLNRLVNDGLADEEIATVLGRTESAVYQKRRKIQQGGF